MNPSEPAALAYFPSDYFHARKRFLALAGRQGAQIASHPIAARGPAGETLSIDTAYLGAAEPRRLLVVCAGTHGVEGFAGSALQQQWLDRFTPAQMPEGAGCLLIHAVNPHGFAWLRRTNENNVDLNRNALAHFPGPANPAYRRLDTWLNPQSAPGAPDLFLLKGAALLLRHGFAALQQAIVEGQYEYPRGLFYGGERLEQSVEIVLGILGQHRWADVERAVVIDIHTGIGRFATYKLMVDYPETSAPYRRLQDWFGAAAVASNRPADSIAYRVNGGLTERMAQDLGVERTYAAVLEIGTVPATRLIAALRRENRAYHYDARSGVRRRAHAAMREVFCPRSPAWRRRVLLQGDRVLQQAARACFSRAPGAAGPAPRQAE